MGEKSIFDFLKDIFSTKPKWDEFSSVDKKAFSGYMINRFISMDMDYINIINEFQQYSLNNELIYKLYSSVFPKRNFFAKYIKAKNTKDDLYSEKLIQFFIERYPWNENETRQNLSMVSIDDIVEELKNYALTEGEIKKLIKK